MLRCDVCTESITSVEYSYVIIRGPSPHELDRHLGTCPGLWIVAVARVVPAQLVPVEQESPCTSHGGMIVRPWSLMKSLMCLVAGFAQLEFVTGCVNSGLVQLERSPSKTRARLRVLSEAPPQAPLPRASMGSSASVDMCSSTRDTREAVVDVLDARPPPSTCVRVETVNRRRVIAEAPHSRSFNGMSRANTFIRSMLLEPVTVGVIVSGPGFFMLSPDEAWV